MKTELLSYRERWPDLPARWTKPESLHITLAFLGNTSDEELGEVCSLMKQVGERHHSFPLEFGDVMYGPPKTTPRMVWATAKKSSELLALHRDVETSLADSETIRFAAENRPFSPHLTLARLNQWEFRKLDAEERPEIAEDISLRFQVRSIEVMESRLRRSGAEYSVVQSLPLS